MDENHQKSPCKRAILRKDLKDDTCLIGLMSLDRLFQSFGPLCVFRHMEIKIQDEAGCQSLSIEAHAGSCGRDPRKQEPIQWCSMGSLESFFMQMLSDRQKLQFTIMIKYMMQQYTIKDAPASTRAFIHNTHQQQNRFPNEPLFSDGDAKPRVRCTLLRLRV